MLAPLGRDRAEERGCSTPTPGCGHSGEALAEQAQAQPDNQAGARAPAQRIGETMGFLKRDDGAPQAGRPASAVAAAPKTRRTPASYEAGSLAGIPASGRERIARMKQEVARGFFTSDLSVNEFLLVKQAGFEPLGLVLGSSIYHIGFQQAMWNQSQEMGVLTQAMYHARELAMTRMEEEADQLGRRRRRRRAARHRALRLGRRPGRVHRRRNRGQARASGELHRAPNGRPFTSDMIGSGLRDAAARRLPPDRAGDGQLRLPRRPPGDAASRCARSDATSRCRTSPRRSTRRASWRWSGCRTRPTSSSPRASSARGSSSAATAGART